MGFYCSTLGCPLLLRKGGALGRHYRKPHEASAPNPNSLTSELRFLEIELAIWVGKPGGFPRKTRKPGRCGLGCFFESTHDSKGATTPRTPDRKVRALLASGVRSRLSDSYFLEKNAQLLFGKLDSSLLRDDVRGYSFSSMRDFLLDLRTRDRLLNFPGELYLPARAAIMLRGLALLLHVNVSVAELWRPEAERVLAEEAA